MINSYLRACTDYGSPKESILTVKKYVEKCKKEGAKVLAITDTTMYAMMPFYETCTKNDIKPILGGQVYFEAVGNVRPELSFLAKDEIGYHTLCRIMTESQKNIQRDEGLSAQEKKTAKKYPTISKEFLEKEMKEAKGHLFLLSGGVNGVILSIPAKNAERRSIADRFYKDLTEWKKLLKNIEMSDEEIKKMTDRQTALKPVSKTRLDTLESELRSKADCSEEDYRDFMNKKQAIVDATNEIQKLKRMISARKEEQKAFKLSLTAIAKRLNGSTDYSEEEYEKAMNALNKIVKDVFSAEETQDIMRTEMLWFDNIAGHGNFYIEVQNHQIASEKKYMYDLCQMAEELDIPIVATNVAKMANKEDITPRKYINSLYDNSWHEAEEGDSDVFIKTDEELLKDLTASITKQYAEVAMKNREKIAEKCNVKLEKKSHYPVYPCTEAGEDLDDILRKEVANF